MLASFTATAVAAALALSAAPADLTAGSPAPAQISAAQISAAETAAEATAPTWFAGFVGDYFENLVEWRSDPAASYRIAKNSLLPKGLKLDGKAGLVFGVPQEDVVQVTVFDALDRRGRVIYQVANVYNVAYPVVGEPGYDFPDYPDDPDEPIDGVRR